MKLRELRKEDDFYFVGPFWIIGDSLDNINKGNFTIISEKFLVDYSGKPTNKVPKSQYTHEGIWNSKYKSSYNVEYNYYPRGRVSQKNGDSYLNIPDGLNESLIVEKIKDEYDVKRGFKAVKHTDPTSGNHYSFLLK